MRTASQRAGINDRIKTARSSSEIKNLLAVIRGYKKAHPATVRKCERDAKARIQFLENSTAKNT